MDSLKHSNIIGLKKKKAKPKQKHESTTPNHHTQNHAAQENLKLESKNFIPVGGFQCDIFPLRRPV